MFQNTTNIIYSTIYTICLGYYRHINAIYERKVSFREYLCKINVNHCIIYVTIYFIYRPILFKITK